MVYRFVKIAPRIGDSASGVPGLPAVWIYSQSAVYQLGSVLEAILPEFEHGQPHRRQHEIGPTTQCPLKFLTGFGKIPQFQIRVAALKQYFSP
jgi:hypothetical protein